MVHLDLSRHVLGNDAVEGDKGYISQGSERVSHRKEHFATSRFHRVPCQ